MALTQTQVSQLYVAIFNRASEGTGNAFWQTQADMAAAANAMLATPDAQDYFDDSLDTDQAFIEHIYLNTLNKTPDDDADGIAFWVGQLEAGASRGQVVASLVQAIESYGPDGENYDPDDAATVAAYNQFTNRVEVSNYMAENVDNPPTNYAQSTAFDEDLVVTSDPASVTSALASVDVLAAAEDDDDDDPGVVGEIYTLTAGTDRGEEFTGTEDDDFFDAPLDVNLLGLTANSLNSADSLDGGAGRDALWADLIQEGANSRDDSGRAIEPSTEKIEELHFNARETNINGDFAADNTVTVNGRKMLDVDYVESYYSDADLSVRGLTTNKSDGGNTRLNEITVSMDHTAGSTDDTGAIYEGDFGQDDYHQHYINGHFEASSMKVLFEQNYLTPTTIAGTDTVVYELMNMDAVDEGFSPLLGVNVERFEFQLDGVNYDLSEYLDDTDTTGEDIATYADLEAELNTALTALIADNPGVDALENVTITRVENAWTAEHPDTSNTLTGDQIILSAPTTDGLEASEFWAEINPAEEELVLGGQTVRNSARIERANEVPGDDTQELRINIDLEKVGRGEDGGGLIVGGDNYTKGFEIFDVTVKGNSEMPSSLAYLLTTPHDGLEELNITTAEADADDPADLQIGNINTPIYSILDVNDINATTFLGDLDINQAYVVSGGEYDYNFGGGDDNLELFIEDFDPIDEAGVVFDISMGAGDDTVDVDLDGDAVDTIGDSFAIHTLSGDDTVTLQMDPGVSQATMADLNSSGDYLLITTGTGDDTVNLDAYGNFYIETGDGSDFVYINSKSENGNADTGTWNFGPTTSGDDTFGDRVLYKAELTVSFAGFESTVAVDTNKKGNFVADQMTINAAIIEAIEGNYELNALLETELSTDSQRLTVESIAGGLNDLAVALYQPMLVAEDTEADPVETWEVLLSAGDLDAVRKGLIDTTTLTSQGLETVADVVAAANGLSAPDYTFYGSIGQDGDGDNTVYQYITNDTVLDLVENDAGVTPNQDIFDLAGGDLYQDYAAGGSADATTGVNFSTINVGDGSNDIVVMHSNYEESSNVLEITQKFGKVSVLNFHQVSPNDVTLAANVANHALDFTTYLNNDLDPSDNPANNTQSVVDIPVTLNIVDGAEAFTDSAVGNNLAAANSVNMIRFDEDLTDADNLQTFAGLTNSKLLDALNNIDNDADTDYGNLDYDLLSAADYGIAAGDQNALVGTTQTHIVMVENDQNEGEYKVFYLESTIDADGNVIDDGDAGLFDSADLLGTLDFGASINFQLVGSEAYADLLSDLIAAADGTVIGDDDDDDDGDDLIEVDITDGSVVDAADGDYLFSALLGDTDIFSANIANFSAGDVLSINDEFLGADNLLFDTTRTDEINFAFGDMVDFIPSFTINLTDVDADLVADVEAAADSAAALDLLEEAWGDWLPGVDYVPGDDDDDDDDDDFVPQAVTEETNFDADTLRVEAGDAVKFEFGTPLEESAFVNITNFTAGDVLATGFDLTDEHILIEGVGTSKIDVAFGEDVLSFQEIWIASLIGVDEDLVTDVNAAADLDAQIDLIGAVYGEDWIMPA